MIFTSIVSRTVPGSDLARSAVSRRVPRVDFGDCGPLQPCGSDQFGDYAVRSPAAYCVDGGGRRPNARYTSWTWSALRKLRRRSGVVNLAAMPSIA